MMENGGVSENLKLNNKVVFLPGRLMSFATK
jgi:hypothetical protein